LENFDFDVLLPNTTTGAKGGVEAESVRGASGQGGLIYGRHGFAGAVRLAGV
jgi:hypothetical protein